MIGEWSLTFEFRAPYVQSQLGGLIHTAWFPSPGPKGCAEFHSRTLPRLCPVQRAPAGKKTMLRQVGYSEFHSCTLSWAVLCAAYARCGDAESCATVVQAMEARFGRPSPSAMQPSANMSSGAERSGSKGGGKWVRQGGRKVNGVAGGVNGGAASGTHERLHGTQERGDGEQTIGEGKIGLATINGYHAPRAPPELSQTPGLLHSTLNTVSETCLGLLDSTLDTVSESSLGLVDTTLELLEERSLGLLEGCNEFSNGASSLAAAPGDVRPIAGRTSAGAAGRDTRSSRRGRVLGDVRAQQSSGEAAGCKEGGRGKGEDRGKGGGRFLREARPEEARDRDRGSGELSVRRSALTCLIRAHAAGKDAASALAVLGRMQAEGVPLSMRAVNACVRALLRAGQPRAALSLLDEAEALAHPGLTPTGPTFALRLQAAGHARDSGAVRNAWTAMARHGYTPDAVVRARRELSLFLLATARSIVLCGACSKRRGFAQLSQLWLVPKTTVHAARVQYCSC